MADYEAFTRWLAQAGGRDFALGDWDCLIFADGGQAALHGRGFAGDWLGGYMTASGKARSVAQLRRRFGLDGIEAALDQRLVRVAGHPGRGAVALAPGEGYLGFSMGLVTGAGAAFLRPDRGLRQLPLTECAGFWDCAA